MPNDDYSFSFDEYKELKQKQKDEGWKKNFTEASWMQGSPETIAPGSVSDTEKKISQIQFESARDLRSKIDDPRILEFIYSSLPADRMSEADQQRFTQEFSEIKQRVATIGLQESNRAMGQELDDLVARGVLSPQAATKQRIKNEAAVNAVISIYNKKLDAARIGMARGEFFKQAGERMGGASLVSQVNQRNREIYNNVVSGALSNLSHRQGVESNIANRQLSAALQGDIGKSEARGELISGLTELAAPAISQAIKNWNTGNTPTVFSGDNDWGLPDQINYGGR